MRARAKACLWVLCAAACAGALAQTPAPPPKADLQKLDYRLEPRRIADDTWVIEGAVEDFSRANGCNIINTAFIATGEGVVVINTGPSMRYGEQQRRAIARVTDEPVRQVLNLNLHPDYFFGNQAWHDRPTQALEGSIAGMQSEGSAYEDNLYRLCGDWMRGTQSTPAREPTRPQTLTLGRHVLELRRLAGHTSDDLVVIDRRTGVLFPGGLVFADRVPTTPHADLARWLTSLDELAQWQQRGEFQQVVPSHGPVHTGLRGVMQTRDWLVWLGSTMRDPAGPGVDLSELLRTDVPPRFARWAAQPAELHRSLAQLYPREEQRALQAAGATAP